VGEGSQRPARSNATKKAIAGNLYGGIYLDCIIDQKDTKSGMRKDWEGEGVMSEVAGPSSDWRWQESWQT